MRGMRRPTKQPHADFLQRIFVLPSTTSEKEGFAMNRERQNAALGRRAFLRALGVGSTAAVSAPLIDVARADTESRAEMRKARYQPNSPWVQRFYSLARYPVKK
jgi:hypothetical protein